MKGDFVHNCIGMVMFEVAVRAAAVVILLLLFSFRPCRACARASIPGYIPIPGTDRAQITASVVAPWRPPS